MRKLRYWLIRRLAGTDSVIVNCRFSNSSEPFIGETLSGQHLFIADCTFRNLTGIAIDTLTPTSSVGIRNG